MSSPQSQHGLLLLYPVSWKVESREPPRLIWSLVLWRCRPMSHAQPIVHLSKALSVTPIPVPIVDTY